MGDEDKNRLPRINILPLEFSVHLQLLGPMGTFVQRHGRGFWRQNLCQMEGPECKCRLNKPFVTFSVNCELVFYCRIGVIGLMSR